MAPQGLGAPIAPAHLDQFAALIINFHAVFLYGTASISNRISQAELAILVDAGAELHILVGRKACVARFEFSGVFLIFLLDSD